MIKPSFFVMGAQKAGTTTLHEWLCSQKVSLPEIKETHFFSSPEVYKRGYEWYAEQFSKNKDEKTFSIGEVDPDYMFFPDASLRIKSMIDNPKIVIILREPLSRAYSHYLMTLRRGYETLSFSDALAVEEKRCLQSGFNLSHFSYIRRGLYLNQILALKKTFPSSLMLFVKYDDLFASSTSQLEFEKIGKFIGLNMSQAKLFQKKVNAAGKPRSVVLRDFIYKPSLLKKCLGALVPSRELKLRLALWADRFNTLETNDVRDPNWDSSVPIRFHELLLDECRKVGDVSGLNLDNWKNYHEQMITRKKALE